jgi:hypothetical protein
MKDRKCLEDGPVHVEGRACDRQRYPVNSLGSIHNLIARPSTLSTNVKHIFPGCALSSYKRTENFGRRVGLGFGSRFGPWWPADLHVSVRISS